MKRLSFLLVLSCWSLPTAGAAFAAGVVVVKAGDHVAYNQAVEGFQDAFGDALKIMTMEDDLLEPDVLAERVRELNPAVILSVGLTASKLLKEKIKDIPIVFCLSVFPLQNGLKTDNTTGVHLEPSIEYQIRAFKDAIPNLKHLALPYNPARFSDFADEAKVAASKVGVELLALPINDRKKSWETIHQAIEEADALWFIRDPMVISREVFNYSLIMQLEKQVPIVAYSEQFVIKGAFCSCSAKFADQGKIAAEIVKRILNGEKPSDIPIQHPEGTLTINLDTAWKAGVKVPKHVLMRPGVVTVGRLASGGKSQDFPDSPASLDFEK